MINKVFIDPRSRINYASYYIWGFFTILSRKSVTFSLIDLPEDISYTDVERGCAACLIADDGARYKVFIDSHDSGTIVASLYQWADVYAKINVKPEDANKEKLLVIGPSFGVKLWNPFKTTTIAIRNYLLCKKKRGFQISLKSFLANYAYTFVRREYYEAYVAAGEDRRDYCFALSTLWYDNQTHSTTNRFRGVFTKACKRCFSLFEGGFFYIPSRDVEAQFPQYRDYLNEYQGMLITKRIGMKEYLQKTKQSAIVFNTPSVLGCHGWKLGEFLSMGKAMISTPLNNVMPGDFLPGIHFIEARNEEEIEKAVETLRQDEVLRKNLRTNAKAYFDAYLSPVAVINRIIDRCS